MQRCFSIVFFLFVLSATLNSQPLRVGIFANQSVTSLVVIPSGGSYALVGDSLSLGTLKANEAIYLNLSNGKVSLNSLSGKRGVFKRLKLNALSQDATFSCKPITPSCSSRFYDDSFEVIAERTRLIIVNQVDIEKYVSGVVESEGGNYAPDEYYKSQAVLCRTYSFAHFSRHENEGFQLCDGVHCQAYNGRSTNSFIRKAAFETAGIVAVDTDNKYITAAFHANCGGETEDARNVWVQGLPYLKPVKDNYCRGTKAATWEKRIALSDWVAYLNRSNMHVTAEDATYMQCTQLTRQHYYRVNGDSLNFSRIRNDWKLRSSFFSVRIENDMVILSGRGYGHGIGLCQEGAMQMARVGYGYREILNFYYFNIKLVPYQNGK